MEVDVQNEVKQPLLHRTDYTIRVFSKGKTPTRQKVRDEIAKKLGAKPDVVVVRRIRPSFGDAASIVDVSLYANAEDLTAYEPLYMRKRHEKKAAEDAAPEEPAEKAPKEEEKSVEGDA